MRENMSLLSFWGLVFALIAVTLFVVIYSYQKTKGANQNIVEDLRQTLSGHLFGSKDR
jgi:ABC-type multidrug transport system fused ATPase/permease subunit